MPQNDTPEVIIAGGGIAGLATALTLHQIGVSCLVLEQVREPKPLGVGINLQPNAVRELYDLGISADMLDAVGVPAKEWALVGLNGNDIYSEPRGTLAGYHWPQYAVHRGDFHMLLYREVLVRLGEDAIRTGCRVLGYENTNQSVAVMVEGSNGRRETLNANLLIGADGIHSQIRAAMHPDQPPIHWGGALMWRGTTRAKPIRTGSSFVGLGTHRQRMVIYPISPIGKDGLATINWIAEVTVENANDQSDMAWFEQVAIDSFIQHFDGWSWDWLDVPGLIRGATVAYQNPMIDRDPIDTWVDGRTVLLGDAAHAMYPTGSNGASQAIIDARVLGAKLVAHGASEAALEAFNAELCAPVSQLILRNRGAGPFGLLNLVDERCGGQFDDIDAIIPAEERKAFMANYQSAAGFARDALNAAPPTIAAGASCLR